jgi:tRNA pseudouridine13 synthase
MNKIAKNLEERGFINYFGLQRFGTGLVPTQAVGRAMFQQNWELACALILCPITTKATPSADSDAMAVDESDATTPAESSESKKSPQDTRKPFVVEDWKHDLVDHADLGRALENLPRGFAAERDLIRFFAKQPAESRDFLGAMISVRFFFSLLEFVQPFPFHFHYFFQITTGMLKLYVHAYQSWIWNQLASFRIKHLPFKPIIGDLVYDPENRIAQTSTDPTPSSNEPQIPPDELPGTSIHLLETESDCEKFSVDDVVLPIPGCYSKFPTHAVGQLAKKLLSDDQLELGKSGSFYSPFSPVLTLPGNYRHLIRRPTSVQAKVVTYSNDKLPLVHTDRDILAMRRAGQSEPFPPPPGIDEAGSHTAVILDFSLSRSTYATMCLRETMKTSTAKHDLKDQSESHANATAE